jgi:hypothetical protein
VKKDAEFYINYKQIHDKNFKIKLRHNIDRNLLYLNYYNTTITSNKLKVLILDQQQNYKNKNFYINQLDRKFLFFKKIGKDLEYISDSNILKKIYLMRDPKNFSFSIKNYNKTLMIFSDNIEYPFNIKNQNITFIYKNKINNMNYIQYIKYFRSSEIYKHVLMYYKNCQ